MSSISPTSPQTNPSAPILPGGPLANLASAAPVKPIDGQSTYSTDIAGGKTLTIMGFSSVVLTATNEAQQVSFASQQYNDTSRKALYNALIESALNFLSVYKQFTAIASQYANAYNQDNTNINTANSSITAYNNQTLADQTAINNLNAAINNYNDGSLSKADLQIAINTYNAYAAARNSSAVVTNANSAINTFNNNTNGINSQVALVNQELQNGGVGPLPGQQAYGSTTTLMPTGVTFSGPPMTTLSTTISNLPAVTNTMEPNGGGDGSGLATSLFTSFYNLFSTQFALTARILKSQSAYQGFVQFILQGNRPYIPTAFYTPTPRVNSDSGGGGIGQGSGVSLTALITSLSNPLATAIIQQTIYSSQLSSEESPSPTAISQQLEYLRLRLLSQIGLQGGPSTLHLLAGRLPYLDLESSPVALAAGIGVAGETAQAVATGSIQTGIQAILSQAYPNLSTQNLNQLTAQLTASSELFLLGAGLFQLGQALQTPQLFGQVLSTLPSANQLGIVNAPSSASNGLSAADVTALKESLSQSLIAEQNVSQSVAQQIAGQAINASVVNGQLDQQSLINALIQSGADSQRAISAANQAYSYLQSEIISRRISDDTISRNLLNNSILSNELVQTLTANQSNVTNGQLRDQLAQQFIANGATNQQAVITATLAIAGVPGVAPISQSALRTQLNATALSQASGIGSASDAQKIADALVSTVLGPNIPGSQTSLRDLIDTRLKTLIQVQDANVTEQVKETVRTFLKPTVELYVLAERLRDPANTFLLCAQTGIMYDHQMPSNFKKSVDIAG